MDNNRNIEVPEHQAMVDRSVETVEQDLALLELGALDAGHMKIREHAKVNETTETPDYKYLKTDVTGRSKITFCHPAYEPGDNILFTLTGLDHEDGGIYHALAHNICAIIVDNRYDERVSGCWCY
jgi:hypothetical protein